MTCPPVQPSVPFCAASGHLGTVVVRWRFAPAFGAVGPVGYERGSELDMREPSNWRAS